MRGVAWTPDCFDAGTACGLMFAREQPATDVSLTFGPGRTGVDGTVIARGIDATSDLDYIFEVVVPGVAPGRYAIAASSDDTGTAVSDTFAIVAP